MFDAYGDFSERIIANLNILLDTPPEDCGSYTEISSVFTANLHQSSPQEPDWNALRPLFAWTSPSSIKDTFNVTTRHGTALHTDRIPSTTPGAEPPRDARDSGSARSHSTHLETSSSNRP